MKTLRHDDRRRRSRARRLPLGGLAGKRRDQTSDSVKTTRLSKPPGDEGGRRDQARKGGSASHPCGTGATTPQHACSDSGTSRRITVMLALLLSQEQSANIRLTRRRSALASLPPPSPGISTRTKARPRDLGLTTVIPYQDDRLIGRPRHSEEFGRGEIFGGTGNGCEQLQLPGPFRRRREGHGLNRVDAVAGRLEEVVESPAGEE